MDVMVDSLNKRLASKKDQVRIEELKVFRQFPWMLSPEMVLKVNTLLNELGRKRRVDMEMLMLGDKPGDDNNDEPAEGKRVKLSKKSAPSKIEIEVEPAMPTTGASSSPSSSGAAYSTPEKPTTKVYKKQSSEERIRSLFLPATIG